MKKNIKITLSIIFFIAISISTFGITLKQAGDKEIALLNNEFSELKNIRGSRHLDLDDPAVKEILDKGSDTFDADVKNALLISIILTFMYLVILSVYIKKIK